jgi:AraC family transcriptional regulator, positive regulator of tynA and feaB
VLHDHQECLAQDDIGRGLTACSRRLKDTRSRDPECAAIWFCKRSELAGTNFGLAGTGLSGDKALTAIARHNLILLESFASEIEPRLIPAVADRAIDYLSLAVRTSFDDGRRLTQSAACAFHFERATLYVAEHLGDPLLSVEKIARAIGLSSGHLQEIFRASSGTTIAEYVRQQRLARCRRDLADPSLIDNSITSIAFRGGFSESSSFSRAFRNAFRTSPRRYRQASLRTATGH